MSATHCRWSGIPFVAPEPCTVPRPMPRSFYFDPGPPSSPRRLNFYGAFKRGIQAKRFRVNRLHEQALIENELRMCSSLLLGQQDKAVPTAEGAHPFDGVTTPAASASLTEHERDPYEEHGGEG